MSPFEGKPHAVYVPSGTRYLIKATTELTVAIATAPGTRGARPPRYIDPDGLEVETRGKGSNSRQVVDILPEWNPADSLLIVEVITPAGNTSSYPPHKHDRDAIPEESVLEETYYHQVNPQQGFVFQRVYTDERDIDESHAVENHDVMIVPRGYHPVVAPHGYDSYYLNVMAGPTRQWHFKNDPAHEWMIEQK
jgi:5-deoxy-glucuronate isomerase